MAEDIPAFKRPGLPDRAFNKLFGLLIRWGIGLPHNFLVQVHGRKSGRLYSTPVNLLRFRGRRYLVAPRGESEWVRNARAAGELWLRKAFWRRRYRVRELANDEKPEVLQSYLRRFFPTVQRYFPLWFGSKVGAFAAIAARYPVFELQALDDDVA